jgi:hypothetical protein
MVAKAKGSIAMQGQQAGRIESHLALAGYKEIPDDRNDAVSRKSRSAIGNSSRSVVVLKK